MTIPRRYPDFPARLRQLERLLTILARQGVNDAVGELRGLNMDADAIAVLLAHARDLSDDDALGRVAVLAWADIAPEPSRIR